LSLQQPQPSVLMAIPSLSSRSVNAKLVNWLP
jgi:hypothetical protein